MNDLRLSRAKPSARAAAAQAPSSRRLARVCEAAFSVCLLFSLICALECPAHAYVDPGSGLLAYQTLVALVAGTIFYLRQKLRNLVRGARPDNGRKPPL